LLPFVPPHGLLWHERFVIEFRGYMSCAKANTTTASCRRHQARMNERLTESAPDSMHAPADDGRAYYQREVAMAQRLPPVVTAVVYSCDAMSLAGAVAGHQNLISPVLLAPPTRRQGVALLNGVDNTGLPIVSLPPRPPPCHAEGGALTRARFRAVAFSATREAPEMRAWTCQAALLLDTPALGSTPRQAAGGSQQELAIFRWHLTVEPQDGEFVTAADVGRRPFVAAVSQVFDADV
jgi:hypothetical protein